MNDKNQQNQFRKDRSEMNEKILKLDHHRIKRFFNLDANACQNRQLYVWEGEI